MRRTHFGSFPKLLRNTLYNKNSLERGDEDFILIKVGGAKMHNAMLHDYLACQVLPLRYDCFRHPQLILKHALSQGLHDWNNRTVDELEEDADWNSSVCK
jgi:hypothetical protein